MTSSPQAEEADPRIGYGIAILSLATNNGKWRFTTRHGDPDAFEFWNDELQANALLVVSAGGWYVDAQLVEGGCITRLAHGQIGTRHDALRADCESWPRDRFWKDCCENSSFGRARAGEIFDR